MATVPQEALAAIGDCVDAVLACDREDSAAVTAVIARTRNPHGAFALLAVITAGILNRAGLHGTDAEAALEEVTRTAADRMLGVTVPTGNTAMHGGTGSTGAYIAPEIGFDSLRDAVAVLRCAASRDTDGLHAILLGTGQPRNLAGMTASVAAGALRRVGLNDEAVSALLDEISRNIGDFLLDQPAPATQEGGDLSHG